MKLFEIEMHWIAIILIFVQIASATNDSNRTRHGVRELPKNQIVGEKKSCSSSTSVDTYGISDLFSSLSSKFSSLFSPTNFTKGNFSLPNIDVNSIVDPSNFSLTPLKLSIPLIFCISVVVGAIAAIITLIIPAHLQPDNIVNNMLDNMYNFMQQAISDVPSQYGVPDPYSQGSSFGQSATGYSSQAAAYNAPSSTYTDPSSSYGSNLNLHKRYSNSGGGTVNYNPQYPQYLTSNYLRSEKIKKK